MQGDEHLKNYSGLPLIRPPLGPATDYWSGLISGDGGGGGGGGGGICTVFHAL